jgi:hypothetical protein
MPPITRIGLIQCLGAALTLVVIGLAWGELFSTSLSMRYDVELDSGPAGLTIVDVSRAALQDPNGARAGDRVDLRRMSRVDILRLYGAAVGTHVMLPIRRNGAIREVVVQRVPRSGHPVRFISRVATAIAATIALLIVGVLFVRRPSMMTAALLFYSFGVLDVGPVMNQFRAAPDNLYAIVSIVILTAFVELPNFVLLSFLTRFPIVPSGGAARTRMHLADASVVCAAAIALGFALFEPFPLSNWRDEHIAFGSIGILAGLAFTFVAFREASGETRQRIGWVLAGLIVSDLAYQLFLVIDFYVEYDDLAKELALSACTLLAIALPISLAYAILRHRVIDIGFALNRAAVFTAMTLLLVGAFGALQWAANQFIVSETHAQGFLVQLAIAVIVLYLVRIVRTRAEALVSGVFFADRRRRIEAIESITDRTDELDDFEEIGPNIIQGLTTATGIRAGLYVEADSVCEHVAGEALAGIAEAESFPLLVRRRTHGFLLCHPTVREGSFAPDERDALTGLAAAIANARQDLLIEGLNAKIEALNAKLTLPV